MRVRIWLAALLITACEFPTAAPPPPDVVATQVANVKQATLDSEKVKPQDAAAALDFTPVFPVTLLPDTDHRPAMHVYSERGFELKPEVLFYYTAEYPHGRDYLISIQESVKSSHGSRAYQGTEQWATLEGLDIPYRFYKQPGLTDPETTDIHFNASWDHGDLHYLLSVWWHGDVVSRPMTDQERIDACLDIVRSLIRSATRIAASYKPRPTVTPPADPPFHMLPMATQVAILQSPVRIEENNTVKAASEQEALGRLTFKPLRPDVSLVMPNPVSPSMVVRLDKKDKYFPERVQYGYYNGEIAITFEQWPRAATESPHLKTIRSNNDIPTDIEGERVWYGWYGTRDLPVANGQTRQYSRFLAKWWHNQIDYSLDIEWPTSATTDNKTLEAQSLALIGAIIQQSDRS